MNDSLEIGQVLSLRIRFNNNNIISSSKHPYLIVDINDEFNTVEIAQIDSLDGKEYKAAILRLPVFLDFLSDYLEFERLVGYTNFVCKKGQAVFDGVSEPVTGHFLSLIHI